MWLDGVPVPVGGKTTLNAEMVAAALRRGAVFAYIDTEGFRPFENVDGEQHGAVVIVDSYVR